MSDLTSDNHCLSNPTTDVQLTANTVDRLVEGPALARYLLAASAENTRRAYRSDLTHFLAWGGSIPASSEQIVAYLVAHAPRLKVATLKRRLVALGHAHRAQGLENPCSAYIVGQVLRGVARVHGSAQRQVTPILRDDIVAMTQGLSGIRGSRDKALLLLGFAGAFRRSELVSLDVSDLQFVEQGLIVHLRRSKTDQEGEGRGVAVPYGQSGTCAIHSLQEWLVAAHIDVGPVFRPVTRVGHILPTRLTGHAVAKIIKERAGEAGLDGASYSGIPYAPASLLPPLRPEN